MAILSLLGLSVKVIVTEHSVPTHQTMPWIWKQLGRFSYPFAFKFIVPSQALKEAFSAGLQKCARIIPNLVVFAPKTVAQGTTGPNTTAIRCLAVGRSEKVKDFEFLIHAFALVAVRYPEATLTIYGEDSERAALEAQIAALGLTERVFLPSFEENMLERYQEADIYILSSRHEAFPSTLLEAMAACVAVVSVDCPVGSRSIIDQGQDGILVETRTPAELAQAIKKLVASSTLREKLGLKARAVTSKFSVERVGQEWLEMLNIEPAQQVGSEEPEAQCASHF